MITLVRLKLVMALLSLALIVLSLVVFISNAKLQQTSIETWYYHHHHHHHRRRLLLLHYHHYHYRLSNRISGLVFLITGLLFKQAMVLDHSRARASLLTTSMLVIIIGISTSRCYFDYKSIKDFDICGASKTFNKAVPFVYNGESYYYIGDKLMTTQEGLCLVENPIGGQSENCCCYSQRQKQCYGFSVDCYSIYVEIPEKLLLLSKILAASLILAVALIFIAIMAIKATYFQQSDSHPVPADATTIDPAQQMDDNSPHTKVINIDEAIPINIEDHVDSANCVTVQGFVQKPIDVKCAYKC